MRYASIIWCIEVPGLNIYLFRKRRQELIKNHMETPQGYRAVLRPWVEAGLCEIVRDEIRFFNGSKIFLCHLNLESDVEKFMGTEMHVLMCDEAQQFSETSYRRLRSRVRMSGLQLPKKYAGIFPRIVLSATPGGIGHAWLADGFVNPAHGTEIWTTPPEEGSFSRQFIFAKGIRDNPSLPPDYFESLKGLGSPELVASMLHGDWSIISGAFFTEFDYSEHVIDPFKLEPWWTRIMAVDQGFHDPWSGHWGAILDNDYWLKDKLLPRGSIIVYRERSGTRKTVDDIADAIIAAENGELIADRVLDPSAFPHGSGPSEHEGYAKKGLYFRKADNQRVPARGTPGGFNEIRTRLRGVDGAPLVYIFRDCHNLIKYLPLMQHDTMQPEQMMKMRGEDSVDSFRYLLMSRPFITPAPPPPPSFKNPTMGQVRDQTLRRNRNRDNRI